MSTFDEEHGLDAPKCPKCGFPGCVQGKGCKKRQTQKRHRDELAKVEAERDALTMQLGDLLLKTVARRDFDELLAERDALKAELAERTSERDGARSNLAGAHDREATLKAQVERLTAGVAAFITAIRTLPRPIAVSLLAQVEALKESNHD